MSTAHNSVDEFVTYRLRLAIEERYENDPQLLNAVVASLANYYHVDADQILHPQQDAYTLRHAKLTAALLHMNFPEYEDFLDLIHHNFGQISSGGGVPPLLRFEHAMHYIDRKIASLNEEKEFSPTTAQEFIDFKRERRIADYYKTPDNFNAAVTEAANFYTEPEDMLLHPKPGYTMQQLVITAGLLRLLPEEFPTLRRLVKLELDFLPRGEHGGHKAQDHLKVEQHIHDYLHPDISLPPKGPAVQAIDRKLTPRNPPRQRPRRAHFPRANNAHTVQEYIDIERSDSNRFPNPGIYPIILKKLAGDYGEPFDVLMNGGQNGMIRHQGRLVAAALMLSPHHVVGFVDLVHIESGFKNPVQPAHTPDPLPPYKELLDYVTHTIVPAITAGQSLDEIKPPRPTQPYRDGGGNKNYLGRT